MKATHRIFLIVLVLVSAGIAVALYGLNHNLFNSVLETRDLLSLRVDETPAVYPTKLKIYLATKSSEGRRVWNG
jgi:hypothetical protein